MESATAVKGEELGRVESNPNGIQKTAAELEKFRDALASIGMPNQDTKALKAFLGGIMVGVAVGHVTPQGANAISNAAGKILKTVEIEHKLGSKGVGELQPIRLT